MGISNRKILPPDDPSPNLKNHHVTGYIIFYREQRRRLPHAMFKAYRNLSPKARMGVGLTIIAWGCAGPYLSDRAEECSASRQLNRTRRIWKYSSRVSPQSIAVSMPM